MSTPPGTDLVYAAASLEDRKGYALALSRAGDLVPKGFRDNDGSANPGKILLAAEYGNMLGLHPMAAIAGLNIIEGKVSPAPALMSALVRRAGHKLRVRTTGTVRGKDIAVTVTLIRSDDPDNPFESTWDIDRATRAQLWGKPGSWSKYPEAMLKWRAMSEVCRDGAEDLLLGAHYVPEELGADVNEAGELVDLTPTAVDRTTRPAPQPKAEPDVEDAVIVPDEPEQPRNRPEPAFDPSPWEDALVEASNLGALRKLWLRAEAERVLDRQLSNGKTLRAVMLATKAHMEQDARDTPQPAQEAQKAPETPQEAAQPVLVPAIDYDDPTPF